jgi:hypothetical protein
LLTVNKLPDKLSDTENISPDTPLTVNTVLPDPYTANAGDSDPLITSDPVITADPENGKPAPAPPIAADDV